MAHGQVEFGPRHPVTYVTCRGLFPDPAFDPRYGCPPPHQHDRLVWERLPPGGYFQGVVCVDGSGRNAMHPRLARAGWAVVNVDPRGNMLGDVMAETLRRAREVRQLLLYA